MPGTTVRTPGESALVCFTASEAHSFGGVPQFLYRYAPRLRALGLTVTILAGAGPQDEPSLPIDGMIAVQGLGKRFTLKGALALAGAVLRRPRGTVLIGNSLNAALVTAVTARLAGRRSLFFVHGLTSRYQRGLTRVACRLAELTAAAFCDAVVVLNADDGQTLSTARQVVRFDHGVEVPPPRPVEYEPDAPLGLLCIARHEPQKNLDAMLRALAACRRPFRLTLIGDGAQFEANARLITELDLSKRATLIRHCAPDALPWAQHDAFLLCSLSEGMPLSLLEAFANGLPAIVTAAPGLGALVETGVTGVVLDRLDGPHLDEAMGAVGAHYEAMAMAARREAETRYDIDGSAARLASIIRSFAPA